jgi:hypothetical protein
MIGAVNIAALLAAPLAKGLFHKAIISSGGLNDLNHHDWAVAREDLYATLRGVAGVEWDAITGEPLIESLGKANLEQIIAATAKVCVCLISPSVVGCRDTRVVFVCEPRRTPFTQAKDTLLDEHGIATAPSWVHLSGENDPVLPTSILDRVGAGCAAGVALMVGSCTNEWPDFMSALLTSMVGLPTVVAQTLVSHLFHKETGAFARLPLLRRALGSQRKEVIPDEELKVLHKELAVSLKLSDEQKSGEQRGFYDHWLAMHTEDPVPRMAQLLFDAPQNMLAALQSKHGPVFSYRLELSKTQSPLVSMTLSTFVVRTCSNP